jgi:hypothetical protein
MKKFLVVLAVAMIVTLMATAAMAGTGVIGSKHDMTAAAYYSNADLSACQYCHTPHRAQVGAPLWNRSLTVGNVQADGTGAYTLYTTLSGNPTGAPGTNSKTCLSCHDGTVAVNSVVVGAGAATVTGPALTAGMISSVQGNIGTDLSNDHPIGIIYNSAYVGSRAGLNTVEFNADPQHANGWRIYGGNDGTGMVECGSCHDPHNMTVGQTPF